MKTTPLNHNQGLAAWMRLEIQARLTRVFTQKQAEVIFGRFLAGALIILSCSAHADFDSFVYTANDLLDGKAGGVGWSGPWAPVHTNWIITAGSLTDPSGLF